MAVRASVAQVARVTPGVLGLSFDAKAANTRDTDAGKVRLDLERVVNDGPLWLMEFSS